MPGQQENHLARPNFYPPWPLSLSHLSRLALPTAPLKPNPVLIVRRRLPVPIVPRPIIPIASCLPRAHSPHASASDAATDYLSFFLGCAFTVDVPQPQGIVPISCSDFREEEPGTGRKSYLAPQRDTPPLRGRASSARNSAGSAATTRTAGSWAACAPTAVRASRTMDDSHCGEHLTAGMAGEKTMEAVRDLFKKVVRKHFRFELLNRLSEIVIFEPLSQEKLKEIVKIQMKSVVARVVDKGISLFAIDAALDVILSKSYNPELMKGVNYGECSIPYDIALIQAQVFDTRSGI